MNTTEVLDQIVQPPAGPRFTWIQLPIEYAKVVAALSSKLDSYDLAMLIELGRQVYQAGEPSAQCQERSEVIKR